MATVADDGLFSPTLHPPRAGAAETDYASMTGTNGRQTVGRIVYDAPVLECEAC